jgi:hypothetical protein
VVAVDAGSMQIQSLEGAALSRAETVLQGTTHDILGAEIAYGEKVSRRLRLNAVTGNLKSLKAHCPARRSGQ